MPDTKQPTYVFGLKPLSAILLAAVVLGAVYLAFLWGSSKPASTLEAFRDSVKVYQATVIDPILQENARIKVEVDELQQTNNTLQKFGDSLKTDTRKIKNQVSRLGLENSKLRDSLQNNLPDVVADSCKPVFALADSLQKEVDGLKVVLNGTETQLTIREEGLRLMTRAADLNKTRADSLEYVINNWPKVPPRKPLKIFGLELDGKTSFWVGLATGTAATLLITK